MDYELRFPPLRDRGEVLRFPCDYKGRADVDAMDRMTRNNYSMRALVGTDFSMARVPCRPRPLYIGTRRTDALAAP